MQRIAKQFCDMVRIDSESGDEAQFIDYLKELFEKDLGADCVLDAFGNLIARVAGKNSEKTTPVLLCSHADTVKPGTGIEPIIKDGIISSAGDTVLGADDKAGIAEIFEAVLTAEQRPPIEILITRSEEIGLIGAKNVDCSMLQAKMGFVIDGDEPDTITIGGPSHVSIDIEIIGKAAHAGMEPEKGISAIRVAARAITSMPEGRIDEETTANIGIIQGGVIRNGVPEKAMIKAECRSLNHDKCMRQAEIIRDAFEAAADEFGAKVKVNLDLEYEAFQISDTAPVVQVAKQVIASAGLQPRTAVITGGTDALVLSRRGITSVVLGYGGKKEHSNEEWIAIASMEQEVAIIRHLLQTLA